MALKSDSDDRDKEAEERRRRQQKMADDARKRAQKQEDDARKRRQDALSRRRQQLEQRFQRRMDLVVRDSDRTLDMLRRVVDDPTMPRHIRDRAVFQAERVSRRREKSLAVLEGEMDARVQMAEGSSKIRQQAIQNNIARLMRQTGMSRKDASSEIASRMGIDEERRAMAEEVGAGEGRVAYRPFGGSAASVRPTRGQRAAGAQAAVDEYEKEVRDRRLLEMAGREGGRLLPALDLKEVRAALRRQNDRERLMAPTRMGAGDAFAAYRAGIRSPEIEAALGTLPTSRRFGAETASMAGRSDVGRGPALEGVTGMANVPPGISDIGGESMAPAFGGEEAAADLPPVPSMEGLLEEPVPFRQPSMKTRKRPRPFFDLARPQEGFNLEDFSVLGRALIGRGGG